MSFQRTIIDEISCDLCGKTNKERKCDFRGYTAWQRLRINGIDEKSVDKRVLQYEPHSLLSDVKHLCPWCAELVYDLMSRKHFWIKVMQK